MIINKEMIRSLITLFIFENELHVESTNITEISRAINEKGISSKPLVTKDPKNTEYYINHPKVLTSKVGGFETGNTVTIMEVSGYIFALSDNNFDGDYSLNIVSLSEEGDVLLTGTREVFHVIIKHLTHFIKMHLSLIGEAVR